MHAYGTFTQYAGLGVLFNLPVRGDVPGTWDASAYTGIKFWAKGSPSYLKVLGQMPATQSVANGGTCTTSSCAANYYLLTTLSSSWQQFTIPFAYLTSGTATPFKPASLWSIEFGPYATVTSFDFWIDDLMLYK